jgi:hypothetical protein
MVPGTDVSVTFSNYGRKINIDDARQRITQAASEVIRQITAGHSQDPVNDVLRYTSGATLVLYPSPSLSWHTWGIAINGILAFIEIYEAVEFIFSIKKGSMEGVGNGYLALTSLDQFAGHLPITATPSLTSRTFEVNSTSMNETIPSSPSK